MKVVVASLNPAIERLLVVPTNTPGAVHRLTRSETLAGGKGVNVARVLQQLATPEFAISDTERVLSPILVGPLGGPTGELQAALMTAENLEAETVAISEWTRVNEVLVDQSDPENATVYNAVGPVLDDAEREALHALAATSIDDATFVICTGSLPPGLPSGFYADWIRAARAAGVPSLLDAHGAALAYGAEAVPTIVKVNRDELADLASAASTSSEKLVSKWLQDGTETVIITNGSGSAQARTSMEVLEIVPPRVNTRSSVGSGDAFTAGLVWSFLHHPHSSWAQHLTVGAACGASNATNTVARLSSEHPPRALVSDVVVRENRVRD
ncbi:1-phosphofructokinase [Microbacterium pseudoresistens]|uniref:1-phosphofructokinase family hexose kinase n=1 Tax=Microbacterium pseudoresistens TaxID=640634 RepID=A0A7Y9EUP6_9MICO|nr:PfkB family carbohydrate kinase [Microbacterium pseudoresistens]NYD54176.1 1-phosphofructokinase family hexose kinase [Microbacterium pseudoresistens]